MNSAGSKNYANAYRKIQVTNQQDKIRTMADDLKNKVRK
jgi:hypothetical protein